jgi:ATP-binding cassette subfamily B protein
MKLRRLHHSIGSVLRRIRKKQVRVIHQTASTDCGAACLAMVLDYFGITVSEGKLRDECAPGRDGIHAGAIAEAARKRGLRVKPYSVDTVERLRLLDTPSILHWKFNHFVVLTGWRNDTAVIVDPMAGKRLVRSKELSDSFTGVALAFQKPDLPMVFEKKQSEFRSWLKHWLQLTRNGPIHKFAAFVLAGSALQQLCALSIPLLTKALIDQWLPIYNNAAIILVAIGVITIGLTQALLVYIRSQLLIQIRCRIDARLMATIVRHILSLPLAFFHNNSTGDLITRLGGLTDLHESLLQHATAAMLDGLFLVIYTALLAIMAPSLLYVLAAGVAFQILHWLVSREHLRNSSYAHLFARVPEQGYLIEIFRGISVIKASGAEDIAYEKWRSLYVETTNTSLDHSRAEARYSAINSAIRNVLPIAVLWLAAAGAMRGRWTIGTTFAMVLVANLIMQPMSTLLGALRAIFMAQVHLARLRELLQMPPEANMGAGVRRQKGLTGAIEVSKMTFHYTALGQPILKDVNFSLSSGDCVAIVGPSGSGKTTLALILLGLVVPSSGVVCYDGLPIQQYEIGWLRRRIGIVMQDPIMFAGSIRENVTFNNPQVDLDAIEQACTVACFHEDVARMPLRYETILSEGGGNLSGGQRQRLALARALVSKPSIIVLDEATSHLDAAVESRVNRNLKSLSCTRIIVAHRLSSILNADKILLISPERTVMMGTHQGLLASSSYYRELLGAQTACEGTSLTAAAPCEEVPCAM